MDDCRVVVVWEGSNFMICCMLLFLVFGFVLVVMGEVSIVDESVCLKLGELVCIDIVFGELMIVGSDDDCLWVYGEFEDGLIGLWFVCDGGVMEVCIKLFFRFWLCWLCYDELCYVVWLMIEFLCNMFFFVVMCEGCVDV